MAEMEHAIILGFAYLSAKHALGDFFLQTAYQYRNKGIYGHPGGILHAGIHLALTAPVFFILPPASALYGIAILAGEFVVHYHIDWLKEQAMKRNAWTVEDPGYWQALGLDQLGHNLTYVTIVWLLIP